MVTLLCAAYVMATLDRFVVVMLVPGVKASLGISDTQVSMLNGAAFAFFYAAALLVFGPLADRTNRRNLLLFGLTGWSLATVASGFAHTFPQLVTARIAVGICQAALTPTALSMVTDEAPQDLRGRAVAVVVSGGTFGAAAANMVGGGLMQVFTAHPVSPLGISMAPWQTVLVVCGLPGLLLAPLLLTIREPERQTVSAGPRFRILPHIGKNAGAFVPLLAACVCFLMAGYAQANWAPIVMIRNLHLPPAEVGLIIGGVALAGGAVSAGFGGWLSDRFVRHDPNGGRLKLLIMLLPISAAASLGITAVDYPVVVVGCFAVTAIAATMITVLAYTILPELVPSEGRGQIVATLGLVGTICGMGLAPTMVALITDHVLHDESRVPLSLVMVVAPALLLASAMAALALPRATALRKRIRVLTGEA
jgi:MFS family permease